MEAYLQLLMDSSSIMLTRQLIHYNIFYLQIILAASKNEVLWVRIYYTVKSQRIR